MNARAQSGPAWRRLSDTATNLYAETLEQLLADEAGGLDRHLRGGFKRRVLGGGEYWYYQFRDLDQRVRQIYCGPTGGPWDAIAEHDREPGPDAGIDSQAQATLLRAAGVPAMPRGPFRLLDALADAGLFKAGTTLVGTYAFMALGNQLGVAWAGRAATKQDVDIAHGRSVELAVPGAGLDLPDVLEGLKMGYHPVPRLDPRDPSTSFMFRGQELRVDLLTPRHGRRSKPIAIPALGAAAQPLKFLDYLLEAPQPALVVGPGVIRVTIPEPARYAVHKLLVSAERPASEAVKSRKDLAQAGQLLEVLATDRPGDIAPAWEAACARGPGWAKRLQRATGRLPSCARTALPPPAMN